MRPATEHRLDFCWLLSTAGAERTPTEASEQYEVLVLVQGGANSVRRARP